MRSVGRFLNISILLLLALAFILLLSATRNRAKAERAKIEERVKLAALAAKSTFDQELAHFDKEVQRAAHWLSDGHSYHKSHPRIALRFKNLLEDLPIIEQVDIAYGNSKHFVIARQGNKVQSCLSNNDQGSDECLLLDGNNEHVITINDQPSKAKSAQWFAKALNAGGRTAWTFDKSNSSPTLIGSRYLPAKDSLSQLAVVAIAFNVERLVSRMRRVPSRIEGISVMRFADGTFALPYGEGKNKELQEICTAVSDLADVQIHSTTFDLIIDGLDYKAFVNQLSLVDLDPALFTIIPQEKPGFMAALNRYLIGGYLLVAGLAVLLFLGWYKSRVDARKISVHEERSKTQQRKLKQALGEREVLDREVHHRVKNNLQIISSLLNMQKMKLEENESDIEIIDKTKKRIEAIGALHNAIYDAKDLRGIDMSAFLNSIAAWVQREFSAGGSTVSYEVDVANISVDMDNAIDVGMIAMELITNAFQHAFPNGEVGHVDISLKHEKRNRFRLYVHDNGVGMGADLLDRENSSRMGLDIVDVLVEGLEGTFSYLSDDGAKCEATMRLIPRESLERPE